MLDGSHILVTQSKIDERIYSKGGTNDRLTSLTIRLMRWICLFFSKYRNHTIHLQKILPVHIVASCLEAIECLSLSAQHQLFPCEFNLQCMHP